MPRRSKRLKEKDESVESQHRVESHAMTNVDIGGSGTSCSRPSVVSYLHYGYTGPSCQQVCLVTEPDGQKTYTSVSFISLFSKQLATLLKDCQFQDEVPTIIVPVSVDILQKLLKFLSIGTVMCGDIENAFSIGKAADVLGITHEDWKIETFPLKPVEVSAGYSVSHENHSECNIADIKIKGQDINANLKHSKESRKFPCSLCKSSFKKMSHLNIHMQTHRPNDLGVVKSRKFEEQAVDVSSCDVCGKSYKSKGSLIAHTIVKHSSTNSPLQVTNKQCPICKKTIHENYLGQHINLHLPDRKRNYSCSKCESTYYDKKGLKRHVKTKHGKVDTHQKRFSLNLIDDRPVNSRKYEEEKDNVSGKSYTTRGNLIAHKLAKHSSNSISPPHLTSKQCPICKKKLHERYLGQHLDLHFHFSMIEKEVTLAASASLHNVKRNTSQGI
eukprot:GFUD01018587.1.p1 GENE.GFUD01018587.1~~GFUD01018587.1.p1  ORF type:complete len:442 (-),score=62.89 GFUD01018587.1:9-1334(-)